MRRSRLLAVGAVVAAGAAAPAASAAVGPPSQASSLSPFLPACNGAPQNGTEFRNTEVEPFVDLNPSNPSALIGVYQQDRLATGGANGLGTSISADGGATWAQLGVGALPLFSRCAG